MKLAQSLPTWINSEVFAVLPSRQDTPSPARLRSIRMPETATPLPETALASGKPRILVVDSEPTTRLLGRMLAQECEIQTVQSAAQVMDHAIHPERMPDLILLDVNPPSRDGLETCRQLKANESTQSVPVILITDRDNAEDEAQALRLGAEDCITRPFRPDVFEARVRNQIRNKIRNDLLERYANQDSLTDIANRRCFDLALNAEWRRATREQQCLSMLMVDVDCFKQFNDLYGHREGDHCLRRVAKAMTQALTRPGDLLARYGGEEFAAILPGTDLEGARWIGERLRHAVMELDIPQQRPDGARQVTISVGCSSVLPSSSLTCYSLLQNADDRLYLAKHSGRNCVR